MNLKIQFYSFVVSFLFGMLFFILLDTNKKIIYMSFNFGKILVSLLFLLAMSLLYFLLLLYINHGYIHIYFFLCIIVGYVVCKVIYKKIVKR